MAIFILQSRYMTPDLVARLGAKFRNKQWVQDAAWHILLKSIEKDKERIKERSWNPYVIAKSMWWYDDAGN